jgi:hypothetical protein
MTFARFVVCIPVCLLLADTAIAGGVQVGVPLGTTVGVTVGQVLGVASALPIAGLSLLGVAVAGIAIGVRIVRRKRRDK